MENWKCIKGFEGIYQISNLGRVRRWRKKQKFWFVLKPLNHSAGYKRVKLRNKGNDRDAYIHILVIEAFKPNETGEVVNHIDGNRENNALENLEYVSQRENISHGKIVKKFTGTRKRGSKYSSRIFIDGKRVFLGSFNCQTSAHFAYLKALKNYGITNKYA